MMGANRWRIWVDRIGIAFEFLCLLATAFVGWASKADLTKTPKPLHGLVEFLQPHAVWFLIGLPILVLILQTARRLLGRAWYWRTIKYLLDEMRKEVFDGEKKVTAHSDRVTLFRRKTTKIGLHWPVFGGCIFPVERSGHLTRASRVRFIAKDSGKAEGIAGRTWANNMVIYVPDLPNLGRDASMAEIENYARLGFVPVRWVRRQVKRGKSLPRSICGIPVEVEGLWGVIVIDSCLPRMRKINNVYEFYDRYAGVLSKLLKEV